MHKKKLYNFILFFIETLSKGLDKSWRSNDQREKVNTKTIRMSEKNWIIILEEFQWRDLLKICSEILLSINHRLSVDNPVVSANADKKRAFMTHNIFYSTLCVSTVACAIGADLRN